MNLMSLRNKPRDRAAHAEFLIVRMRAENKNGSHDQVLGVAPRFAKWGEMEMERRLPSG